MEGAAALRLGRRRGRGSRRRRACSKACSRVVRGESLGLKRQGAPGLFQPRMHGWLGCRSPGPDLVGRHGILAARKHGVPLCSCLLHCSRARGGAPWHQEVGRHPASKRSATATSHQCKLLTPAPCPISGGRVQGPQQLACCSSSLAAYSRGRPSAVPGMSPMCCSASCSRFSPTASRCTGQSTSARRTRSFYACIWQSNHSIPAQPGRKRRASPACGQTCSAWQGIPAPRLLTAWGSVSGLWCITPWVWPRAVWLLASLKARSAAEGWRPCRQAKDPALRSLIMCKDSSGSQNIHKAALLQRGNDRRAPHLHPCPRGLRHAPSTSRRS